MNITNNPRQYVLANILELVVAILRQWLQQSVLAVVPANKVNSEPASVVLAGLVDSDKTYRIGERKYTGAALVELAGKVDTLPELAVVDGRHRAIALAIANGIRRQDGKPAIVPVTVTVDNGQLAALEGNAANEYVTRLDRRSKVTEALALYRNGTYKAESDLPFKRGFNQFVHSACACILAGGDTDKVLTLDKETLRKCSKEVDVSAAVNAAYEANGGDKSPDKPLTGKQLLALAELATKANSPLASLLTAIAVGNELHAQGIVRASAAANETAAVTESNRQETAKQNGKQKSK